MPYKIPDAIRPLQADQTIVTTRIVPAMQRLTDALRSGYTHHVGGEIENGKLARLIEKLQQRYPGLARNRKHASRLGLAGRQRAKLIVFYLRSAGRSLWWLLTDQPDENEAWANARTKAGRITAFQYQSVQIPKPGTDAPVWTWKLSAQADAEYRDFIKSSIRGRGNLDPLLLFIAQSRSWAGFHGVRAQRVQLQRLTAAEWKRAGHTTKPPAWPRLRYVQRVAS